MIFRELFKTGKIVFLISFIIFAYWLCKSDSVKRIWKRIFASLSIESFSAPAVILVSGIIKAAAKNPGEAIGILFGTGVVTLVLGVFFVFLGIIFFAAMMLVNKSIKNY